MGLPDRLLIIFAAVAGFCGVMLAAAGAHMAGGANLVTSANFLLFHAPVLLAVPLLIGTGAVHHRLARLAGYAIAVGLILFSGVLAGRALTETAFLPMAAPTGGVMLMLGWALVAVSALMRPGR
jgi:uncharacterized membrane protein YgdD (TMEM256/DUF423 family)